MKRLLTRSIVALAVLWLGGCNTAPQRDPAYAPVRPIVMPVPPQGNGAIYQAGYEHSWFEDLRARRVGDMLTVKLAEATDATKNAATNLSKSNSNSVTNPTLLGSTPQFNTPSVLPLASNTDNTLATSLESSHSFAGSGDSTQSNELTGDITVTVVEVLPNGYLMVRGEKRIGINQGNEYVRVAGIVRPADIDSTNTVLSTRIADPTLVYVGDGAVADSNVVGWLSRFFVSVLFPF
ncbi:MAG: flagellar basal body L-ring protein [Candidatus Sedimenticola endophacoides]|uniref:Flagellar L-ring protein n=1 Tax=Candidatus Sedimenticola endophacoides TaxID=2548426 RepID=A0A6N4DWZ6_9GAMM|nr:MAG: flagellar basal body L-ring protein [Candidatus Sedimenticola endophacoides]OQX47802.1 MAG: flagellar basal body L-ring protein [Candidatus Sedimenticola endophacoides]PUD99944.1 MAG: flagellar basal body L-ring protein FlgH [Candidatus Sedimenticola endophacoides]PUE01857.1 MAG: flagellar basal body L-ring protein FlgH [Candidatus Sedimenticola endophacoides]PUE03686.1 MAG: flagellar basal body L-ring protein FlgH [Candidatus Sedimenticola endophacoides]